MMNFKNAIKKQNLMPVIVLVAICLAVALLLAGINMFTAPEIERRKQEAIDASFKVVLPEGKNFEKIDTPDGVSETIDTVYKADGGYVFEITVKGKEMITLMCGVNSDGEVTGVEIISEKETPGYKDKILPLVTGEGGKYNGMTSDTLAPEVATGATLTSNAIYNAVKASLDAFIVLGGGELEGEEPLPRTDEELKSLSAALIGTTVDKLTDVTPDGLDKVKRVYRDETGSNYVVYTLVISSHYGTPETETLIHVNSTGSIKGIERLTWKVSDPAPDWGYNPPSEDALDAFYNGLVGKDDTTIDEVDVATGATNTTTALVAAIKEAITVVKDLVVKDMPTDEATVKVLAAELLATDVENLEDVTPEGLEKIRRVYRDKITRNYVAYAVVLSSYYGTVETESLIHVGSNGEIKGMKKITWKVSDAVPEWGYNPPSAEEVDAFYNSLVGKNDTTIDGVDVSTGATNTTTALVAVVKEAITVVKELVVKDMPTDEATVKALAAELLATDVENLEDVTPDGYANLRRIYRDKISRNYVAYAVVLSSYYGTVETESLVHIGSDGVIKGIKKMTWKVSDAVPEWGYNPPSAEAVDAFYNGLVGKNGTTIDDVDVSTGATNTTTAMVSAVKSAIEAVKTLAFKDMPTDEATVKALAAELLGTTVGSLEDITPSGTELVRRVYLDRQGNGFAVYAAVISSYYGTVETETLIHVDENGVIKGIKKMTWSVSDAKPEYNYNPPSAEEVDAFYNGLVGKNSETIKAVDTATGATNTTNNLVKSVTEALNIVDGIEIEKEESLLPRIIGIIVISAAVLGFVAYLVAPKFIKRRKI